MNRDGRDRYADLFVRLVNRHASDPPGDDELAALKLLSNAFLNYIDSTESPTPDKPVEASITDSMPWLFALHRWSCRDWDAGDVANFLASSHAVQALGERQLILHLSAPVDESGAMPRAPRLSVVRDDHHSIMGQLADMEAELRHFERMGQRQRLTELVSNTSLARSVAELNSLDAEAPLAVEIAEETDGLIDVDGFPWRRRFRVFEPLAVLGGLEDLEGRHPMSARGFEFSQRDRGFERGLATNLAEHGLAPAVRAALIFGRGDQTDDRALSELLRRAEPFHEDPALEALALALANIRGRCHDHMRGLLPLSELDEWVRFLRDGCVELAESRDITLREATGYAHYALHLVNMCDFCAEGPSACNSDTREALVQLEDELKEFALAGRREGFDDIASSLAAFERARWRRKGPAAELANRLTRLRGAWKYGIERGPVGAPPTLDEARTAHSLALVESQFTPAAQLETFVESLRMARLDNFDWHDDLTPNQVLTCLATALAQARDLAGLDITRPFRINFGPVANWLLQDTHRATNRDALGRMLSHLSVQDILDASEEASMLQVGLVGTVRSGGGALPVLDIEFVATEEMSAILQLLSSTADDDPLADTLRDRLDGILDARRSTEGPASDAVDRTDESMVGTVFPDRGVAL